MRRDANYSLHMADAATDSFDRDLVLGLVSFEQEGLYEIDAALKRIEDGTYGVCELTGKAIRGSDWSNSVDSLFNRGRKSDRGECSSSYRSTRKGPHG